MNERSKPMEKNNKPIFTGVISGYKKNVGEIALWENEIRSEKSPRYKGIIKIFKRKYRVAIW